jgi:ribosomal protein S18 acetylase RimI-like enzyme
MARLVAVPERISPSIAEKITELDEICFPGDYRVRIPNTWWWFVYDAHGEIAAYAGLRECTQTCNRGLGYLCRAGVLKKYRGNGLQKELINARVRYAKKLGLRQAVTYVAPSNLASANSLVSCGFRLYSPEYRWGGKDCFYLRKILG